MLSSGFSVFVSSISARYAHSTQHTQPQTLARAHIHEVIAVLLQKCNNIQKQSNANFIWLQLAELRLRMRLERTAIVIRLAQWNMRRERVSAQLMLRATKCGSQFAPVAQISERNRECARVHTSLNWFASQLYSWNSRFARRRHRRCVALNTRILSDSVFCLCTQSLQVLCWQHEPTNHLTQNTCKN